ncbi:alpha/beta fold hydrolase [Umezawaea sp. Da 62-37]|uniref:alpha/beta fold hydrolase n=1 Tax=Umezawaea sp. Da 62-37 TaxID=3075927 RepID=UPI0028F6C979|nr:alpha/beta fold hydrolase [Umezawaea sp. Da 62-37]WNV85947.1 alpha/beta fold hydrolase [Umezawaea sp. Da 62-37]
MRRQAQVAAAVVLAAITAVAPAHADPLDPYTGQRITWGPCAFTPAEGAPAVECALVEVPRDWADPASGVDLDVSLSRSRATGERKGVLLINPGGPGGKGTGFANSVAGLAPEVNAAYDFIGMDPRGTGTSPQDSGFQCHVPTGRLPQGLLDARDRSAQSVAAHQQLPRAIAEACQSDAVAPYTTTWQTAHDMDLVRSLLGEDEINYLGYSYGTWLGAKYASLFPANTGKVVLDSSVNWQGRLQAAFEAFPEIDQRQFDAQYLPWTTRHYPEVVGTTPAEAKATWERARGYFAAHQLPPDNFDRAFVGMGSPLGWLLATLVFVVSANSADGGEAVDPALPAEFDEVSRAEFGVPAADLTPERITAAAPDYTDVSGTRFAVACGDQETRSAAWYKALSDRQGPLNPVYGWAYGLSEPCAYWSDAPRQQLPTLPPQVAANVLVVQGEMDPQTGYEQARAAVRAAPGVGFVSVDDAAYHGQYATSGNPCVDGMVEVFLLHNSRPGTAVCPGVPLLQEDTVFPVAGPVRAPVAVQAAQTPTPATPLRDQVQRYLGEVNSFR